MHETHFTITEIMDAEERPGIIIKDGEIDINKVDVDLKSYDFKANYKIYVVGNVRQFFSSCTVQFANVFYTETFDMADQHAQAIINDPQ